MISDCPPGHASEVSKERFSEENDFSCSWPLSRRVEQQCQRNGPISRCMRLHAWPSVLPFALVGRQISHHSRSLPSSTSVSLLLSSLWLCGGRPRTEGSCRRLGCVLQIFIRRPASAGTMHHPCSSRDSRCSVGRLRIVLPKITSQKLASYF